MKTYKTITLKQIIVLLAIIFVSYGCGRSQEEIASSQLQERKGPLQKKVIREQLQRRNGVHYEENGEVPYTGRAISKYPSGQKQVKFTFKDGKLDGPYTWWHENGQKSMETSYKDGKLDGPYTWWHENGQKSVETSYKDGKEDGTCILWYRNGKQQEETTYKDGKLISIKSWDIDGNIIEQTQVTD